MSRTALFYLILYILIISFIDFCVCGWDKRCARKGKWRVPEATLLLLGLLGGCFGLLVGMSVFRHKTQHWKFKILVPLECVLWIAFIGYLISGQNGVVLQTAPYFGPIGYKSFIYKALAACKIYSNIFSALGDRPAYRRRLRIPLQAFQSGPFLQSGTLPMHPRFRADIFQGHDQQSSLPEIHYFPP